MQLILLLASVFVLANGSSLPAKPPPEVAVVPHQKLCPKNGKVKKLPAVFPSPRREAVSCGKDRKVLGCLTPDAMFVKLNSTFKHLWVGPQRGFTYECIGTQKMAFIGRKACLMGDGMFSIEHNSYGWWKGNLCRCDVNKPSEEPSCIPQIEMPIEIETAPGFRIQPYRVNTQIQPKGAQPRPVRRSVPIKSNFFGKLKEENQVAKLKPAQPVALKAEEEPVVVSKKDAEKGSLIQFNFIFTE